MFKNALAYITLFLCFFLLVIPGTLLAQANRGVAVPVKDLPDELKNLDIKDHFMPSTLKRVGVIHALNGRVVVIHRISKQAYFGMAGDAIYENDAITTLRNSKCRIRFADEDVVTLASQTNLNVEEFRDQRGEGKKTSLLSMAKGKAMFYALRLFSYKETRFRVRTPTTVVGVRGTKFGTHVYWIEGDQATRNNLKVADLGKGLGHYLTQVSPEAQGKSYTDAFSEDGFLDVEGKVVGPGEIYRGDTGQITLTPPEYISAFEEETEVKKEEEKVGEEEAKEEEKEAEKEAEKEGEGEEADDETTEEVATDDTGETTTTDIADISENLSDTTQQEIATTTETENVAAAATGSQAVVGGGILAVGKTAGEVSAIATIILLNSATGEAKKNTSPAKDPIYISEDHNHLIGGAETHIAYEVGHQNDPNFIMKVQEESAASMDAKVTDVRWGSPSNQAIGSPHSFTWTQAGQYTDANGSEYLRWGFWEDLNANPGLIGNDGNDFYAATAKIWEVEGDLTHPDIISALQQQGTVYTYKGEAKGVYADSSAADTANLTGDFSCSVDFGNTQVSDFTIDVDDGAGGHAVNLSGGSGSLNSEGGFNIDNFSGTINGSTIPSGDSLASGGLVGGKAEGVGGVWAAHDGNDKWATGEFHGKR